MEPSCWSFGSEAAKRSSAAGDYNANDEFPENFWSAGEEWSGGHLILGYKVEDVAITGEDVIDDEAFVLTSHGIHPDAKHIHMKTEWLARILATAEESGVAVLGFDELGR